MPYAIGVQGVAIADDLGGISSEACNVAVAAVGIPGFGNGDICQGNSLIRINEDRIFIRAVR